MTETERLEYLRNIQEPLNLLVRGKRLERKVLATLANRCEDKKLNKRFSQMLDTLIQELDEVVEYRNKVNIEIRHILFAQNRDQRAQ